MGKGLRPLARRKWSQRENLPALLVVLIVLFLLLLDFLGWYMGTRSFIFSLFLPPRVERPETLALLSVLWEELSIQEVKAKSVRHYSDNKGVLHVNVDIPLETYKAITASLAKRFLAAGAKIAGKETAWERNREFHLWRVQGRNEAAMVVLFSSPAPEKKRPVEAKPARRRPSGPGLVALIIDDLGNNLEAARTLCRLGIPLTVSILPYAGVAAETAQLAHECGLEVILHLPMESLNHHPTESTTPGMLLVDMTEDFLRRTTEDCLAQVPYIRGVNNHMGSRLTEDETALRIVLGTLRGKELYFVDSRTSQKSRARDVARSLGIPSASSQIFVDGEEEAATKAHLEELVRSADSTGRAIGIGHPYPATLAALTECPSLAERYGVRFVFASRVVSD